MTKRYRALPALRTTVLAAAAVVACVTLTQGATAATYQTFDAGLPNDNVVSGTFGNSYVTGFSTDTFNYTLSPVPGTLEITNQANNLSNTTLIIEGNVVAPTFTSPNGLFHFYYNVSSFMLNPLTITFSYIAGLGGGSYGASFTYTTANGQEGGGIAVPGPIAGAGIPAAFAFGGLLWARRRKTAAA